MQYTPIPHFPHIRFQERAPGIRFLHVNRACKATAEALNTLAAADIGAHGKARALAQQARTSALTAVEKMRCKDRVGIFALELALSAADAADEAARAAFYVDRARAYAKKGWPGRVASDLDNLQRIADETDFFNVYLAVTSAIDRLEPQEQVAKRNQKKAHLATAKAKYHATRAAI